MIPKQLQHKDNRFVLVRAKDKAPFEQDWVNTNNYTFDDPKVQEHLKAGGNVGFLTGLGSVVLDCDVQQAENLARQFPKTLVIGTSMIQEDGKDFRKKHFYFSSDMTKKVILKDHDKHLGEIQARGQMVLCPPSVHPSGAKYEVIEDNPIAEVKEELFKKWASPFITDTAKGVKRTEAIDDSDEVCAEIKKRLKIPALLKAYGFDVTKNPTNCLWHESQGGQCFSYKDDLWNCFHCGAGGNIFHLVMKHEGIGFVEAKKKLAEGLKIDESKLKKGKSKKSKNDKEEKVPTTSMFYDPAKKILYEEVWNIVDGAKFVYMNEGEVKTVDQIDGYEPIEAEEVFKRAILLPEKAEPYGDIMDLVKEIHNHIHKYLDIPERYEKICVYYILLSWLYDKFNTIPYLSALGDTATGKSRMLSTVGRLLYKSTVISGAVTPAPIYRLIDKWRGSLIIDEADWRDSSEQAEIITILNSGYERNTPVVRCKMDQPDTLQFFDTFSPKIVGRRRAFRDVALEGRCLTNIMRKTTRRDVPRVLGDKFFEEQQDLRNKLLWYRLEYFNKIDTNIEIDQSIFDDVDPRIEQITQAFFILFENISDEIKQDFVDFIQEYNRQMVEDRSVTMEGWIMNTLFDLIMVSDNDPPIISSSDIVDKINSQIKDDKKKKTAVTIGKYLKTIGITTRQRKIEGKIKREVLFDDNILELLKTYVPKDDDFQVKKERLEEIIVGVKREREREEKSTLVSFSKSSQDVSETPSSDTSDTSDTPKAKKSPLEVKDTSNKVSKVSGVSKHGEYTKNNNNRGKPPSSDKPGKKPKSVVLESSTGKRGGISKENHQKKKNLSLPHTSDTPDTFDTPKSQKLSPTDDDNGVISKKEPSALQDRSKENNTVISTRQDRPVSQKLEAWKQSGKEKDVHESFIKDMFGLKDAEIEYLKDRGLILEISPGMFNLV